MLSRIAQTTTAFTWLKPVLNEKSISVTSKIRLIRSLVTSIFLFACESWTLTAELQRRIQAMDVMCCRKILRISYKVHVTNEKVRAKIQQAIGRHEDLLNIVKRRKLQRYRHVFHSSCLSKHHLARYSERWKKTRQTEEVGRQNHGMDRPGVGQSQKTVENREKMEETGCEIICGVPTTLPVKV